MGLNDEENIDRSLSDVLLGKYGFYTSNSEEFEFPIEAGKKADDYSFYIVAVDNVGNEQLVEPEHWNVLTGIETISTTGNSDGWMVTRLDGRVVASGKGTPLLNLPSGIYIVRQGNQARKVVVK